MISFLMRIVLTACVALGIAALASPLRIRREKDVCIDCAKCAKACPSQLPVDRLVTIRSAECLGCMECVNVCPAEGALDMKALARKRVAPWMIAAAVGVIFFGLVGFAKLTGRWDTSMPNAVYERLIPASQELTHP